jgi:hypothetical protein
MFVSIKDTESPDEPMAIVPFTFELKFLAKSRRGF